MCMCLHVAASMHISAHVSMDTCACISMCVHVHASAGLPPGFQASRPPASVQACLPRHLLPPCPMSQEGKVRVPREGLPERTSSSNRVLKGEALKHRLYHQRRRPSSPITGRRDRHSSSGSLFAAPLMVAGHRGGWPASPPHYAQGQVGSAHTRIPAPPLRALPR